MLKLVDLTYHTNTEFDRPTELLQAQEESLGYVNSIRQLVDIQVIKHTPREDAVSIGGITYNFFKRAGFLKIPFTTLRYLKKINPDVILIQGFIFPIQVLLLRLLFGRKIILILQHHGEQPCPGLTLIFQKLISRSVDAYVFTSLGNSREWIQRKIISGPDTCYEIQAASTSFVKQDKAASQLRCGMSGVHNFLWVGRLNENKDPLTVLSGFASYLETFPDAKLYMIYRDDKCRHSEYK